MIVTGASSGIGRAVAEKAGKKGARLVLAARRKARLDELAGALQATGVEALAVEADLTRPEDRRGIFDAACERFGGVDILVNNAGVAAHGHFIDLDPDILRQVMEINFFAVAENCRLAIPLLAEGVQPLIVNVSSMAGRRGVPAWTEYSSSKFAVCGFSEALRAELARFDIDLTLVVPGLTRSELGARLLARKGRLPIDHEAGVPTETVADRIIRAMERNQHEVRVERSARLLLLLNRLAPRFIDWRMAQVVRRLYSTEIADRHSRRVAAPVDAT